RPKLSAPQLLEITVRFLTPFSFRAATRFSALPESPKPPDITVMPSNTTPSSADAASAYTFPAILENSRACHHIIARGAPRNLAPKKEGSSGLPLDPQLSASNAGTSGRFTG